MSRHLQNLLFSKYEGLGNDFILIDDRKNSFPLRDRKGIARLCHRKLGIGADGLILLQLDPKAHFRMRIFNQDGSEAESCGNGLRCFFQFIQELGYREYSYLVRMHRRYLWGHIRDAEVFVDMGKAEKMALHLLQEEGGVHFVNTGVPHVVQFVENVKTVDVACFGAYLRHHPRFSPKGVNVNFAEELANSRFAVRTFERGVEAETLACGTGAVAVSAIALALKKRGEEIEILFSEGSLKIKKEQGRYWMAGPARRLYTGTLQ